MIIPLLDLQINSAFEVDDAEPSPNASTIHDGIAKVCSYEEISTYLQMMPPKQ
jgi:hypothetical protein